MFQKLHRKMTLLYTLTTGAILTFVLVILLFYNEQLLTMKSEESFQSATLTIVSKLQSGGSVSHAWLSQMEVENDLIIYIEDNGIPLLYPGAWTPPTDRDILIQKAQEWAAGHKIDTSVVPVSSGIRQSDVFRIYGNHRDLYQGIVIKIPSASKYQSLVLLNSLQPVKASFFRQKLFFILLDIVGILSLFIVSWNFVKKSLDPIRESKEKQDAFIAAASHELRSPIAVIQASANAMSAKPEEAPHLSSNILSECRRLSRLVSDLLTLASSDASSWSVNLTSVDLDTILLNIYELFESICREKHITLELSLPDDPLPFVNGDEERLLQLLSILLDNAVSYSDNGSSVCIEAEQIHRFNYIRIVDHGVGIPDEEKERIFERFYRTDHSRNDKKHFGLGLSIARELTKLHRRELILSDTEGGGATFTLKLPTTDNTH